MAELLTAEIVADFQRRAAELPDNGNQDIGARRKLRQELQSMADPGVIIASRENLWKKRYTGIS